MTTFISTISLINQKYSYLLTLGALVIVAAMLLVFGWFSYEITAFLSDNPAAHYLATFIMAAILIASTIALAIYFNSPKRRK